MDNKEIAIQFRKYLDDNFERDIDAASFFDVSQGFISMVVNGRKLPNKTMLEAMGLEKKVVYVEKK